MSRTAVSRSTTADDIGDAESSGPISTRQLLIAILAVLLEERERRPQGDRPRSSELVLSELGFPSPVIGTLLGRRAAAVRVTLSRERRKAAAGGGRAKKDEPVTDVQAEA